MFLVLISVRGWVRVLLVVAICRAANLYKLHFLVIHSQRLVWIDGRKLEGGRRKELMRKERSSTAEKETK
jgi:hypothetical protein